MCVHIDHSFKMRGYNPGCRYWATQGVAGIAQLALFIIGCIGAAGAFPGSSIGWAAIGLGGGAFIFSLANGNLGGRAPEIIVSLLTTIALVTVGALGSAGVLTTTQVGWGIVGTFLASGPFVCISEFCKVNQIQSSEY